VGLDPNAPGPALDGRDPVTTPFIETSVGFRDYVVYAEHAFNDQVSAFADVPIRSISPEVNASFTGISDIKLGLKYAFIATPDPYLTAQLKAYLPSGGAMKGLGTDHATLEPGLLYYDHVSDRVELMGEFR